MENNYLGKLPLELYKSGKTEEIINYLSENKVCMKMITQNYSAKLKKTNDLGVMSAKINQKKVHNTLKFEDSLINEFYSFLLKHYISGLKNYIMVDLDLSKETFGIPFEDKRNIALEYFNRHLNEISIPIQFSFAFDNNRNVIPATNFQKLKRVRDGLRSKLGKNIDLLLPYLAGELIFFNRELFETNTLIKKIFHFENILRILLKINKEYKFEDDEIFNTKSKAKLIYEKYSHQFESLKQIEFIENQINSGGKIDRAFVVCLFDFFSTELNIKRPSGKIFGEIINDYFSHNFGIIKLNGAEGNSHFIKIKILKKEWENFNN